MASNHPPGRVLCRRKPHGQPQGETAQEEDTCGFGFNPRPDLHLQPLQPDMPLPHRLYQSRACLQATWTTPLLNLRSQSHAMMMYSVRYIICEYLSFLNKNTIFDHGIKIWNNHINLKNKFKAQLLGNLIESVLKVKNG